MIKMTNDDIIYQPKKLYKLSVYALAEWIASEAGKDKSKTQDKYPLMTKEDDYNLPKKVHVQNYFENLPVVVHNTLFSEIIKHFIILEYKLANEINPITNEEYSEKKYVINKVIDALLTNNLTDLKLNRQQFYAYEESFCTKGYMLRGLTDLKLDIPLEDTDPFGDTIVNECVAHIIQFLKQLHGLKHLSINCCTNKILQCIAENCTSIENLELFIFKLYLRKETVNILSELPKLKTIELHYLPSYMGIISDFLDHENSVKQLLEVIATNDKLKIKSYVHYDVSPLSQLRLVVKTNPKIENLTFVAVKSEQSLEKYHEIVKDLKHLLKLDLVNFDFYSGQVKELLELVGKNLEELKLYRIREVDLNEINQIHEMCPKLEVLLN